MLLVIVEGKFVIEFSSGISKALSCESPSFIVKLKHDPFSSSDQTFIFCPPSFITSIFDIVSPRPTPCGLIEKLFSIFPKFLNKRLILSLGIPIPVSVHFIVKYCSECFASNVITPCFVNFFALLKRFKIICFMR